jgi:RimJ/RimL family protein N-acetyltransferase
VGIAVQWVDECMGVGEVVAGVEVDNVGSGKLMEKVGFVREMVIEIPWPDGGTREIGHYVKRF